MRYLWRYALCSWRGHEPIWDQCRACRNKGLMCCQALCETCTTVPMCWVCYKVVAGAGRGARMAVGDPCAHLVDPDRP